MKKFFAFCAAIIISTAFSLAAFSEGAELPAALKEKFSFVYESASSFDGEWFFASGTSVQTGKNALYSFNTKAKKSFLIFEPLVESDFRFVHGMAFYEKTKKLYFIVHCGYLKVNGQKDTFYHNGLYSVAPDGEGQYSAHGLVRYSQLARWVLRFIYAAYITAPASPDYKGFLQALYTYADTDSNPVFAVQTDDGKLLQEEDAVKYLISQNKMNDFLNQNSDGDVFLLKKYLFLRDADGNATDKSAVTFYKKNPLYKNYASLIYTESSFAVANDSVYFILMKGTIKNKGMINEDFGYDYSLVYQIKDGENGLEIFIPEALKDVRARQFPWTGGDPLPIEERDGRLFIRDIDGVTNWIFDGKELKIYSEKAGRKKIAADSANKGAVYATLFVFALVFFAASILLLLLARFFVLPLSKKQRQVFAYKIQEEKKDCPRHSRYDCAGYPRVTHRRRNAKGSKK